MKTKATVLTLVLALMLSVAGLASAQGGPPDDRPERPDRPRVDLLREMATILTDATGLTPLEIREQVREGATLAEVIENSGADVDTVVSDSVTAITERVNNAVAEDSITQERADEMLESLEENIRERLNSDRPLERPRDRRGTARQVMRVVAETITDELGVEPRELVQAVRGGSTPAEFIEANGGDVDTMTQTVIDTLTERINQAVEDGNLPEERAEQMLENMDEHINNLMNGTLRDNRPGAGDDS